MNIAQVAEVAHNTLRAFNMTENRAMDSNPPVWSELDAAEQREMTMRVQNCLAAHQRDDKQYRIQVQSRLSGRLFIAVVYAFIKEDAARVADRLTGEKGNTV